MIDDLPPLRDVLTQCGISPKKSLGQNFILDLNLTRKIASAAGELQGHHVVEIGPGPGGLTRAILSLGAAHVFVIERDQRCLDALHDISKAVPGRLTIIEDDALDTDYEQFRSAAMPVKIIANLPYNIATPLLIGWLKSDPWPPWFQSMTLMFQREVAERIVAEPGDKHYGRLGVFANWRCHCTSLFDISPEAFTPPPKVTSSVVHFEPIAEPLATSVDQLERITAAAFQQRRKMLRSSLKRLFDDPTRLLDDLGIDPTARAETLTIKDFVALANSN